VNRVSRLGRAPAAAAAAILIWSTNAAAAGAALRGLTVTQVLALQFGGACATLAAARALSSTRRGGDAAARMSLNVPVAVVAVAGLAGTMALQYVAFALAPLVAANAIAYAWPLIVAAWLGVARGSRRPLALALAGFAGVLLLFAARDGGAGGGSAPLAGYVAALGSAVAMAGYTLSAGRVATRATDLVLLGAAVGAAVAIPAAVAQGASWSHGWAVALGLYIGIGPVAVGWGLWTFAMADPDAARLAPLGYATPLLSTCVLLATGQRLAPLALLGCALIVLCATGVVVDALRPATDLADAPRAKCPPYRGHAAARS
jgi:drug/metabolite transporter (DMT)-like permease